MNSLASPRRKFQPRCRWRSSECDLYWVSTPMRRMPELMQFDSAKSTMRNLPPKYTAGLARLVGQVHAAASRARRPAPAPRCAWAAAAPAPSGRWPSRSSRIPVHRVLPGRLSAPASLVTCSSSQPPTVVPLAWLGCRTLSPWRPRAPRPVAAAAAATTIGADAAGFRHRGGCDGLGRGRGPGVPLMAAPGAGAPERDRPAAAVDRLGRHAAGPDGAAGRRACASRSGICLNSRFPMFVWWGPALVNIYNDAYIPVLGQRHPQRVRPAGAATTWGEIWDVVGPPGRGRDAATARPPGTSACCCVMERNGYSEDTWFTWSYSPIYDERRRHRRPVLRLHRGDRPRWWPSASATG